MQWFLREGDILDVEADVLICSANVFLNLSGGVGGAFGLRYGPAMQDALHTYLAMRGITHVARGDIVAMQPCESGYRTVLHAVAVDGLYESSAEIVAQVISDALGCAAVLGAKSVALTALATGYGRLSMTDFANALLLVVDGSWPPLETITIGLRSHDDCEELKARVPRLSLTKPQHR
jgi:O-acetyl-ADP-ribose deacetylase (regulator of RNase III)